MPTIKKCDWGRKKERERDKLKSLIGFLSANKIDNYNGAGGRGEEKKKEKKNLKESHNKSRNENH